jgi:beta-N-acetylhexosaminidase
MSSRSARARIGTGVLALVVACIAIYLGGGPAGASPVDRASRAAQSPVNPGALSPQQLAGQRVIFSFSGLAPPPALLAKIAAGEAAGVIFFSDNISSEAQVETVIGELQRAAALSPVKEPLLVMTDQEGGQVRRLPGAPTLSEKQIGGARNAASAAQRAGRGAGVNLAGVGMNVNLAPVLDVYHAAGDFIDRYGRSYGSNARRVAQLGADFIKAQQQVGVGATAKHFPGLGAATRTEDTDAASVTLDAPLASLRSVDELPYQAAISAGVWLVMVSWATYPALDPRHPAGLSSIVVQGELRKRLRFGGVTITDALEAGALRPFGSTSNRAVLAAGAGMDLLLCASQSVNQGTSAVNALAAALTSGKLNRSAFNGSVERVLALRNSLGT